MRGPNSSYGRPGLIDFNDKLPPRRSLVLPLQALAHLPAANRPSPIRSCSTAGLPPLPVRTISIEKRKVFLLMTLLRQRGLHQFMPALVAPRGFPS